MFLQVVPWQIKPVYATSIQITYYPYTIISSGSYVVSGANSSSTANLITISADNVFLDGQNYQLTGTGSNNGVYSTNHNNITVVNMNMTNFEYSSVFGDSGFPCTGVDVENCSFYSGGAVSAGVLFRYGSNNCTARNIYCSSILTGGIYCGSSSYNLLISNITGSDHHLVLFSGCYNFTVQNCNCSGGDSTSYLIEGGDYNFTVRNCISTNSGSRGVELDGCTNATVNNCTVINPSDAGIVLEGTSVPDGTTDVNVTQCQLFNVTASFGIYGKSGVANCTVSQCLLNNTLYGFWDSSIGDGNITLSLNYFVNDGTAVYLQNTGNTTLLHNAYSGSGANSYTSATNNIVNDSSLGLAVSVVGSGTVSPPIGLNYVNGGNWSQTFTATPSSGYSLTAFKLNGMTVGTSSPLVQAITVDSTMEIDLPLAPPTFSSISANTSTAGKPCSFSCLISDNVNVSTYIFSTNNTGTWTNDTATAFSNFYNTTAAWANVTKTLNDTIGNVVSYLWYANNTSNNWSISDQYDLVLTAPFACVILSPTNTTYTTPNVQLTFTINEITSWMGYSLDGQDNVTIVDNTTLTGLSDGSHQIIVYANDPLGNMDASPLTYFEVDTTAPDIAILSPENLTYATSDLQLTFLVNESASWIGYSLDDLANVTIAGNTTLVGLSEGSHTVIVYANDTVGNMGISDIVQFIVVLPDITVVNMTVSKTVVGQSFSLNASVAVANNGDSTETFNVTAYANTTYITSQNVTLSSGNSANVTFTWNTTGFAYGNYTISAYAWPVPGETNTANNNCTGGWVIVSIIGDITGPNGWPDGQVNMRDIARVARAFGSSAGSPNWNPNADFNNDGIVDMKDIALVARNFGQHYP